MYVRTLTFTLSLLAATSSSAARAAETYTVDPTHTSIVFSCGHTGLSYTYGMFRKAEGSYVIDKLDPANCRFRIVVDAGSIDTNHAERDDHLRSADFFNVKEFPTITFESTACTLASTQPAVVYNVTGKLTLHGVTREVNIPVQWLGEGNGVHGDQRSGLYCHFELKRSDYGMTGLLNLVGDAVGITASLEGVQQPEGAASPPAR